MKKIILTLLIGFTLTGCGKEGIQESRLTDNEIAFIQSIEGVWQGVGIDQNIITINELSITDNGIESAYSISLPDTFFIENTFIKFELLTTDSLSLVSKGRVLEDGSKKTDLAENYLMQ